MWYLEVTEDDLAEDDAPTGSEAAQAGRVAGRGWRTIATAASRERRAPRCGRAPGGAGGHGEHGGLHEHDGPLGGGEQLLEPPVEGEQPLGRGEVAADEDGQAAHEAEPGADGEGHRAATR